MGAFVIPRGLLILPVLALLFVSYSSGTEVPTIDIYKAKALLQSGYTYLDIRTEEFFKNGYPDVKNVINIPYIFNTPEGIVQNPDFVKQVISAYGKYVHLIVGCEVGVRSINATADLLNAGFEHVFSMDGGYAAWVKNGLPVKNSGTVVTIETYQAKNLLSAKIVEFGYLDVRTKEEFNNGHVDVKKIVNIPYKFNTSEGLVPNPHFVNEVLSSYSIYDHFIVGCQTGSRSINATTDLVHAGFKHVFNMAGGYAAWVKDGFPVTKP